MDAKTLLPTTLAASGCADNLDLRTADLRGADFAGARLTGCHLDVHSYRAATEPVPLFQLCHFDGRTPTARVSSRSVWKIHPPTARHVDAFGVNRSPVI